jgi:hypothetical protein
MHRKAAVVVAATGLRVAIMAVAEEVIKSFDPAN